MLIIIEYQNLQVNKQLSDKSGAIPSTQAIARQVKEPNAPEQVHVIREYEL